MQAGNRVLYKKSASFSMYILSYKHETDNHFERNAASATDISHEASIINPLGSSKDCNS